MNDKIPSFLGFDSSHDMPEKDEIVEDAGLFDHEHVLENKSRIALKR